jgi:POT family proton-dependent oligopeptide transporter
MPTPSNPTGGAAGIDRPQRTFLGHPLGLYVLFFTEMWERFSYYGMRALLILYMVNYFKWSQKDASEWYKVYTSCVYVTPILGGFLADRYLGNRIAVIIGAVLMAIGQFMLAFEEKTIFLSALVFLILGNGMFKPNMSTQVGRLYPAHDGRRDGAYTIFYMGINLGAFLAPLICGWLAENTVGGYHSGFTMAGIGMVLGLAIYLFGQPLIQEIPPDTSPVTNVAGTPQAQSPTAGDGGQAAAERPLTEAEAARTPSYLGSLAGMVPPALTALAVLMLAAAPVLWRMEILGWFDALMLAIAGVCAGLMAFVCAQITGGMRDRVLAILILGVFVMFFWGAFEQAGNVLNLWADKHTDRYLTQPMQPPELEIGLPKLATSGEEGPRAASILERYRTMFVPKRKPGQEQETWMQWLSKSFNPMPTTWFQSINALAIFVIAPIFAWMWIKLDRRGLQPSIPMKMFLGLVLMCLSVAVMIGAARQADKVSSVPFTSSLPAGIVQEGTKLGFKEKGKFVPFQAGRLLLENGNLSVQGVLPDNDFERIAGKTAPEGFVKKLEELQKESKTIDDKTIKSVSVVLDDAPYEFAQRMEKMQGRAVQYNPATRELTAYAQIKEKEELALRFYASEPTFTKVVEQLFLDSATFRVSSWWLFWSYILATLGELCLSPVGLSMVSKLAPAKFATMLMGMWLLTAAFGNFAAGLAGEHWETFAPADFFVLLTAAVAGAAIVLLLLVRPLVRTMHGVK